MAANSTPQTTANKDLSVALDVLMDDDDPELSGSDTRFKVDVQVSLNVKGPHTGHTTAEDVPQTSAVDPECSLYSTRDDTSEVIGNVSSEVNSDDSDEVRGETNEVVTCAGHTHLETCYLDEIYNFSVDQAFEFLFTDSGFIREFMASRRTFDLDLPDWDADADTIGDRTRTIHFTLTLNLPMGPKTSPSTEKQKCFNGGQPGRHYLVEATVTNNTTPFGDVFCIVVRYCLTRVSVSQCRIHISSSVRYMKPLIRFVRALIDRDIVKGLAKHFGVLGDQLRSASENASPSATRTQTTKLKNRPGHAPILTSINVTSTLRQRTPEAPLSRPSANKYHPQVICSIDNETPWTRNGYVQFITKSLVLSAFILLFFYNPFFV